MSQVQFRTASVNDADEIAQLVNAAYRPQPNAGGWTHESNIVSGNRISSVQVEAVLHDSVVILATHDTEIVACVQIECVGKEAHIGMLAVKPSLQTAGVGKLLLERAEKYAAENLGAEELILVVVEARTELIAFYQRRGYQITDQRLSYPVHAGVGIPLREDLDLLVLSKRALTSHPSRPAKAGG